MRNSSLINFPPVSQEAEGWRKKTLLSVSRRYYIKYNHAPRVFHHALTFHSAIYTCPKGITITDSAQHSISLEKLLSRWCFSFRRHLTHKDWLTGYRAAPNFLNSSSKHRFHYSKCCFTSHGLSPFLPSTHINWTKVPSKSGPAITGKQHYTVSLQRSTAGITCTTNGKSVHRPSRVLETQKAQTRHTAVTATLSRARHQFSSKKTAEHRLMGWE